MRATRISGTAFFKHKYLTNPSVTPEDQIIAAAARPTDAFQGTITANMRTSTLKLLGDLQSIFHDAAKGYDTHQSEAEVPIMHAVQHHAPVSPQTPDNNTPMKSPCAPPRVQSNVTPNIRRNLLGREPPTEQMLPNSPKGGIQSPLHVRHNALPNPNSTPMQTNNTTALSVVNNNVMKKLKAMDMKYYWLQCRESQGQFRHYWASGKTNNGDYVTKHHAPICHQATRPIFLTPIKILQELRRRVTNLP
jgi:hypothetical protein